LTALPNALIRSIAASCAFARLLIFIEFIRTFVALLLGIVLFLPIEKPSIVTGY
jgi:hypothetical protein